MPIVLESGNLNILEPSGPVEACNGIAFTLLYIINIHYEAVGVCLGLGYQASVRKVTSSIPTASPVTASHILKSWNIF